MVEWESFRDEVTFEKSVEELSMMEYSVNGF